MNEYSLAKVQLEIFYWHLNSICLKIISGSHTVQQINKVYWGWYY